MPIGYIDPDNRQSINTIETRWAKAKNIAAAAGHRGNSEYISDIFKTLIKEDVEIYCGQRCSRNSDTNVCRSFRPLTFTSQEHPHGKLPISMDDK